MRNVPDKCQDCKHLGHEAIKVDVGVGMMPVDEVYWCEATADPDTDTPDCKYREVIE